MKIHTVEQGIREAEIMESSWENFGHMLHEGYGGGELK